MPKPTTSLLLLACAAVLCSGCAMYRFGANSLYRQDIRTIHVPMIVSDSYRRDLGEQLGEAICKEIELKTPYKIVSADHADSVLQVRLVTDTKAVLGETIQDDARDIQVDYFAQSSWVDRRGDLLQKYSDIPLPPLLLNTSQAANFIPEAGQSMATARQEALHRLAEQIVGQLECGW
jgi:hypothetical protein